MAFFIISLATHNTNPYTPLCHIRKFLNGILVTFICTSTTEVFASVEVLDASRFNCATKGISVEMRAILGVRNGAYIYQSVYSGFFKGADKVIKGQVAVSDSKNCFKWLWHRLCRLWLNPNRRTSQCKYLCGQCSDKK